MTNEMGQKRMLGIEDSYGNRIPFARYELDERDWAEEDLKEVYQPKYPNASLHIVEFWF
jgi:hypothetical protein